MKQLQITLVLPVRKLEEALKLGELIEITVPKQTNKRGTTRAAHRRNRLPGETLSWTGKAPGTSLSRSEAGIHAAFTKHFALQPEDTTRAVLRDVAENALIEMGYKATTYSSVMSSLVKRGFLKAVITT